MNKLLAIVAALLCLPCAAVAAVALTVSGGGQTTQQATFLAAPITVLVTDNGAPVPYKQVEFLDSTGTILFANRDLTSGDVFVYTDANGVAVAPPAMGFQAGTTSLLIRTVGNDASSVTVPVTVVPGGPTRFEMVSGSHQSATAGTTFAQPWVAQAFDAAGNVVPNAAVLFYAPTDPTVASVTFDGVTSIWVRAEANGIAISPYPTANMVSGHEEGLAMTQNVGVAVQFALFDYNNKAAPNTSGGGSGGGGSGEGCGAQRKGNGNCGQGNGANHGK